MTKDLFIETINALDQQYNKDEANAERLSEIFTDCYKTSLLYDNNLLVNAIIKLLKEAVNDTSNWIEYFIYDLDFGRENYRLNVYSHEGTIIPLATAEDLWNIVHDKE